ncbi:hypothetical protein P9112_007517 [Eukaryota sp. TZLM1-RC]
MSNLTNHLSVVISDAILCLTITFLIIKILKHRRNCSKPAVLRSFVGFSIFSALGASSGAIYHLLEDNLSGRNKFLLWMPVKYTLALSSYFTAMLVVHTHYKAKSNRVLSQIFLIKTSFWIGLLTYQSGFLWTAVDFLTTTVFSIIICAYFYFKHRHSHSSLLLVGWILGLGGVVLQVLKVTVSDVYFNNNDLFHLLAAISTVFIYLATDLYLVETKEELLLTSDDTINV